MDKASLAPENIVSNMPRSNDDKKRMSPKLPPELWLKILDLVVAQSGVIDLKSLLDEGPLVLASHMESFFAALSPNSPPDLESRLSFEVEAERRFYRNNSSVTEYSVLCEWFCSPSRKAFQEEVRNIRIMWKTNGGGWGEDLLGPCLRDKNVHVLSVARLPLLQLSNLENLELTETTSCWRNVINSDKKHLKGASSWIKETIESHASRTSRKGARLAIDSPLVTGFIYTLEPDGSFSETEAWKDFYELIIRFKRRFRMPGIRVLDEVVYKEVTEKIMASPSKQS